MSVWDGVYDSRSTKAIRKQVASGEVPHAWLFLGPSGSGKRMTAVAMAAALNCRTEPGVGCG